MTCPKCGYNVPYGKPGSKVTCPDCGATIPTGASTKNPAGK